MRVDICQHFFYIIGKEDYILNSGVDLTKYGYVEKLIKTTGYTKKIIENTIKKFPNELDNLVFKRKCTN